MDQFSLLGNLASLAGFGFLIIQQVQIYRLRQEMSRRRDAVAEARQHGRLVLNFSGHAMRLSEGGWLEGCHVVHVPSGSVDMARPAVEAAALLERLTLEEAVPLSDGMPVVVALPGATALAAHLLVLIHAVSGSFPLFTWALKLEEGQVWQRPVDLHALRTAGRERRA